MLDQVNLFVSARVGGRASAFPVTAVGVETRRLKGVGTQSHLIKIAQPGQVVVTSTTAALLEGDPRYSRLRSLGEVDVPDFDEPVRAYEVLDSS